MFAPALGRHAGHGAFDQLEQGLLHALARHVTGDGRVVGLARDLVDLVDVDDALLGPLDLVVAALQQLLDDVLDVFTDIAGFRQRGGIGHHERHVEHARQGLGQQRLARTRGADQQDVALGELDIILLGLFLVAKTLVVVVHRHRQDALGVILADDVVVQIALDLGGRGQVAARLARFLACRQLVTDDFVAKVNAFVTDEDRRSGDQLLDFMLALAAKRTVQRLFAGRGAFFLGHVWDAF